MSTRLSQLQARILNELAQAGGRLSRRDLRERLACADPSLSERGRGLWSMWAITPSFSSTLSRSVRNLLDKGWIAGGPEEMRITLAGRRLLERPDFEWLVARPRKRRRRRKKSGR